MVLRRVVGGRGRGAARRHQRVPVAAAAHHAVRRRRRRGRGGRPGEAGRLLGVVARVVPGGKEEGGSAFS